MCKDMTFIGEFSALFVTMTILIRLWVSMLKLLGPYRFS